jgi:hypothetical protein
MGEELFEGEGISRREMLKRSAIVGGASAMVWAAPSVTTFAPRAFGANGTPASDFSNFGAVVLCTRPDGSTTYFKIKGEQEGDLPNFEWEVPGNLGGCEEFVPDWDAATGVLGSDIGASFSQSGSNYIMTLGGPVAAAYADCTFTFVVVSNGVEAAAASLKQGQCCIGAVANAAKTQVTWSGPFPNGSPNDPCSSHPQNLGTPTKP